MICQNTDVCPHIQNGAKEENGAGMEQKTLSTMSRKMRCDYTATLIGFAEKGPG